MAGIALLLPAVSRLIDLAITNDARHFIGLFFSHGSAVFVLCRVFCSGTDTRLKFCSRENRKREKLCKRQRGRERTQKDTAEENGALLNAVIRSLQCFMLSLFFSLFFEFRSSRAFGFALIWINVALLIYDRSQEEFVRAFVWSPNLIKIPKYACTLTMDET